MTAAKIPSLYLYDAISTNVIISVQKNSMKCSNGQLHHVKEHVLSFPKICNIFGPEVHSNFSDPKRIAGLANRVDDTWYSFWVRKFNIVFFNTVYFWWWTQNSLRLSLIYETELENWDGSTDSFSDFQYYNGWWWKLWPWWCHYRGDYNGEDDHDDDKVDDEDDDEDDDEENIERDVESVRGGFIWCDGVIIERFARKHRQYFKTSQTQIQKILKQTLKDKVGWWK